ncbi:MAG: YicC family protein [Crocinitomicaceae bacterium]|nr:YicC family protein [Crocinitomicaceae bacterium]
MWSMTGFGKSSGVFEGKKRSIEIRSLNGKGLDLTVKVPSAFRSIESIIRTEIGQSLERGKVDVGLYLEDSPNTKVSNIDFSLAKAYIADIKQLLREESLEPAEWVGTLTALPGVIKQPSEEITEEEQQFILGLLSEAIQSTMNFRETEGKTLRDDLESSLLQIETLVSQLEPFEKERIVAARARLEQAVKEIDNQDIQNRVEQELLFYMDKLDVSEEKIRLNSHISYFRETMDSNESSGKKLGFIVQEMGREINTLGSKSNHAMMQRMIVEMKNHLEKIKEQVQNVL